MAPDLPRKLGHSGLLPQTINPRQNPDMFFFCQKKSVPSYLKVFSGSTYSLPIVNCCKQFFNLALVLFSSGSLWLWFEEYFISSKNSWRCKTIECWRQREHHCNESTQGYEPIQTGKASIVSTTIWSIRANFCPSNDFGFCFLSKFLTSVTNGSF